MPTGQRDWRDTFDGDALLYDLARPGYPAALFDDLAALADVPPGGQVLEIGCGTGQATIPLARRGYSITAIELGAQLAAVARRNVAPFARVEVITRDFETWPVEAGAFDLVTAATAFHWIDPAQRYAKAAHALRPGGALAPFWNEHVATTRDGGFWRAAQAVYRREVPTWVMATTPMPPPETVPDAEADRITASGLFGPVATRRYVWEVEYDTASFLRLLGTYSDHRSLDPATRGRLLDGLAMLIDTQFGGRIVKGYLTMLYVAHRR